MVKGSVYCRYKKANTQRNLEESRAERERRRLNSRLAMARALWTRGQQQERENRENTVRWGRGARLWGEWVAGGGSLMSWGVRVGKTLKCVTGTEILKERAWALTPTLTDCPVRGKGHDSFWEVGTSFTSFQERLAFFWQPAIFL